MTLTFTYSPLITKPQAADAVDFVPAVTESNITTNNTTDGAAGNGSNGGGGRYGGSQVQSLVGTHFPAVSRVYRFFNYSFIALLLLS